MSVCSYVDIGFAFRLIAAFFRAFLVGDGLLIDAGDSIGGVGVKKLLTSFMEMVSSSFGLEQNEDADLSSVALPNRSAEFVCLTSSILCIANDKSSPNQVICAATAVIQSNATSSIEIALISSSS